MLSCVVSQPTEKKACFLAARTELVFAACLVPLMGADLGRRFLPMVIACDAAPEYGFGVSYRPGSLHTASAIGSLAETVVTTCVFFRTFGFVIACYKFTSPA